VFVSRELPVPSPARHTCRVISADEKSISEAAHAWRAGRAEAARLALDRAESAVPRSARQWLRIQALRGAIELRAGVPADALALLLPATRRALRAEQGDMALRMLMMAREAAFQCARRDAVDDVHAMVALLPPLAEPDLEALRRSLVCYCTADPSAAFTHGRVRTPQATAVVADAVAQAVEVDDPDLLMAAGGMAFGVAQHTLARQLRQRAVTLARARGELGTLATALEFLVPDQISRGQYASARQQADEGLRLAEQAGRENTACSHLSYLAALAALRGDEGTARGLADRVLATALPRQLLRQAGVVQHALGLMALAAGRLEEALAAFDAMLGETPQPGRPELAMTAAPDHIEAAVRAGRPDRVRDMAVAYAEIGEAAGTVESAALVARCRALLATDERGESEYVRGLRLHAQADRPFDHARTQLLYGEYLRRKRQRLRAREQLRSAEQVFNHLNLPIWAGRAATELRATGAVPRTRPGPTEPLTPQELQIARAVAAGATNREVATSMFLSRRTVDYHLRKVFTKLGISSRAELIRNPPDDVSTPTSRSAAERGR
jgi:DNA-binding CsgD family transcriptional regulator